jgi:hypothetical protein
VLTTVVLAWVIAALATGAYLWGVMRMCGTTVPLPDVAPVSALCSGLGMLPTVGWVLGVLVMSLILLRATDADPWPDTLLSTVGSAAIWLVEVYGQVKAALTAA